MCVKIWAKMNIIRWYFLVLNGNSIVWQSCTAFDRICNLWLFRSISFNRTWYFIASFRKRWIEGSSEGFHLKTKLVPCVKIKIWLFPFALPLSWATELFSKTVNANQHLSAISLSGLCGSLCALFDNQSSPHFKLLSSTQEIPVDWNASKISNALITQLSLSSVFASESSVSNSSIRRNSTNIPSTSCCPSLYFLFCAGSWCQTEQVAPFPKS